MIKTFDCVEMKHKAGVKISKKLSKMTSSQQLAYWQDRHQKLITLQEQTRKNASAVLKPKR